MGGFGGDFGEAAVEPSGMEREEPESAINEHLILNVKKRFYCGPLLNHNL